MEPTRILKIQGMPDFETEELKENFFNEAGGNPVISMDGEDIVLTYESADAAEEASSLIKETADAVHGQGTVTVTYQTPPESADLNLALPEESMETSQVEKPAEAGENTKDNGIAESEKGDESKAEEATTEGNRENSGAEQSANEDGADPTEVPPDTHLRLPEEERIPAEIFRPLDYIPPTAESIANISYALWTHPSFYIKTLNLMESLDLPDPCNSGPIKDLDAGSDISHFIKVFPVMRRGAAPRPAPLRNLPSSGGPFDRALVNRFDGPSGRMPPDLLHSPIAGPMSTRQRMLEQQLGTYRPPPIGSIYHQGFGGRPIGRGGFSGGRRSAPYPTYVREGGAPNDPAIKRRRNGRKEQERQMMMMMRGKNRGGGGGKPFTGQGGNSTEGGVPAPAAASEPEKAPEVPQEPATDFAADDSANAATF